MTIRIFTETDLRRSVRLSQEIIDAIEDGFTRLSAGQVTMPPIMRIDFEQVNGEVDVKSAAVNGLGRFAVKVSSGFFDNEELGLPSLSGMMMLFSAKTGFPEAVLLDNGYLTNVRTAAAGGVAARHLARADVETAGVIGAGTQARWQIMALQHERDFRRLLVYSLKGVEDYAEEMRDRIDAEIIPVESAEEVVRGAEIVVTTTPSREPYLRGEWLHPGLHITAMGSDAEVKQELFAEALGRADLLVCDRRSQAFRLGECHHALQAGVLSSQEDALELGEITSGARPGRTSEEQISVCDLTGTGMQDTIIATMAVDIASQHGFGIPIEIEGGGTG